MALMIHKICNKKIEQKQNNRHKVSPNNHQSKLIFKIYRCQKMIEIIEEGVNYNLYETLLNQNHCSIYSSQLFRSSLLFNIFTCT